MHTRYLRTLAAAGLLLLAANASATDLTGHWRMPGAPSTFFYITQTGTAVSFPLSLYGDDWTFTGTFNDTTMTVSASGILHFSMKPLDGGNILDGIAYSSGSFGSDHAYFTRCECFDGDTDDGDGCDAEWLRYHVYGALCEQESRFGCSDRRWHIQRHGERHSQFDRRRG